MELAIVESKVTFSILRSLQVPMIAPPALILALGKNLRSGNATDSFTGT